MDGGSGGSHTHAEGGSGKQLRGREGENVIFLCEIVKFI